MGDRMSQGQPEAVWPQDRRRPSGGPVTVLRTLWALLAVLVVAAVVVPLVAGRSPLGSSAQSARAALRAALTTTMVESTVHVSFSASVGAGALALALSGTGAVDLPSKTLSLHVSASDAGQKQTIAMEMVGGTLYLDFPQITRMDPGKTWVSVATVSSAKTGIGSSIGSLGSTADPGGMLRFLRQSGGTVVSLGPSTLDGTSVVGYRVTLDATSLSKAAANGGLPSGILQGARSASVTVYVGGHLLRGLDVTETGKEAFTMDIDFQDYGAPVTVQPPPATSVVPYSQISKAGVLLAAVTPR
jgi:hypothetical protein